MRKLSMLLVSICSALALLINGCFSVVAQAQIIKPQGEVIGSISREEAINIANRAACAAGYDFSCLPLIETKANLVYSEEDDAYEWIVSYIVEYEGDPYLVITIDAYTGTALSTDKVMFLDLYDQWELQRGMPDLLWPMEDLIFFETLYRRSDLFPRYTLPTEYDMPQEAAVQAARKALCIMYGISNDSLDKYECSCTFRQDPENQRKWDICFCTVVKPTQANVVYQVTLDAQTGKIVICRKN